MRKMTKIVASACMLCSAMIIPLPVFSDSKPINQPYFKAIETDGSPIRKDTCGVNFEETEWITRDFEGGVRGEVGVSYKLHEPLSAKLLFRFSDEKYGKFEIRPEGVRLHIHPGNKYINPISIDHQPFDPKTYHCDYLRHGYWVTMKFPIQLEQTDQVALVFPKGTLSKGEPINVQPFRFKRIDQPHNGSPYASNSPISPPALPPLTPRFGPSESPSTLPPNIKGTWMIDGKATRAFIESIPSPHHADKLAQWLGLIAGYLAHYRYEFDGSLAKGAAFRGSGILELERISDQDSETTFREINSTTPTPRTISVSMLRNGNIRITPSDASEISYLRWQPAQAGMESETPDSVIKIWLASVQEIIKILTTPPALTVKVISKSQIALNEAIKNGLIRQATDEDVKEFYGAYTYKKYTKNNLPIPSREDALSVTKVDTSRAYVVLNEFAYPPGMEDENRVVFFIPQGVPMPSGDIGHSAAYDFATLTVMCTAARTGQMSC